MRFSARNQYFHVYDGDTMIFTVTLSINKPSERDLYNLETKLHCCESYPSPILHCLEAEQDDFILTPLRCLPHSRVYPKSRSSQMHVCRGPQLLPRTSKPRIPSGDCSTFFQEGKVSVH